MITPADSAREPVAPWWHTLLVLGPIIVVTIPLVGLLGHLIGGDVASTVANVVPKTGVELAVFLALTATASFAAGFTAAIC